jgi:hypothetical protein
MAMGQYFILCNIDKKEFMQPKWFGHGHKLPEIARTGDGMMAGLAVLLALSGSYRHFQGPIYGRWAGDRIAIVGDYYQGVVGTLTVTEETYYRIGDQQDGWVDISEHVRRVLETEWGLTLAPARLDGAEPRSMLHSDGTITPIARPAFDEDERDDT